MDETSSNQQNNHFSPKNNNELLEMSEDNNLSHAPQSLLTSNEYQQVIYDWNNTVCEYPNDYTLHDLFVKQAHKTPTNIALIFEDTQYTYQELNEASNRLARFIRNHFQKQQQELTPDTLIALYLNRSIEMNIAILAILKAGGAYVPIDPQFPSERVSYILNDANTSLILTQQHLLSALDSYTKISKINLNDSDYRQESAEPLPSISTPVDLAYVMYTSGTTGKPKGVAVTHTGIVNRIDWMQRTYPLNQDDVVLHKTPYGFDVSVWELLWAHQVGATLIIAKPEGHQDPLYLIQLMHEQHITTTHFVPSMLSAFTQSIAEAKQHIPATLRFVFCSGEALAASQVNAFYNLSAHPVEIHNLYGPTEASIDVTFFPCPRNIDKVYIGKPIQNTQIYILDEALNPVSIGDVGELHIGGIGLARGYFNKPELTARCFISNPFAKSENLDSKLYKTGDLARWTADGNIEYIGRNDFQIKIRGYRIELNEIEHVLSHHPEIRQTVVIVQERNTEHEKHTYLVAYYVSDAPIEESSLLNFLKNHLPEYMLPSAFVHMHSFVLTTNGKLDRKALPHHDFSANAADYIMPKSDLEKKLTAIWSEALDIETIGTEDHFFHLGGHSLIAARIVSTIKNRLQKEVPLTEFYRAGHIANLAVYIANIEHDVIHEAIDILTLPSKKLPLTDFQLILWLSHLFEPKAKKMNIITRKRMQGHLDIDALHHAFQYGFIKQEALHYRISKLYPAQKSRKKLPFTIEVVHLEHEQDPELHLSHSIEELLQVYPWPRNYPLVLARIFYLKNNQTELQLCMPHLIADERSMEILCTELSTGYLAHGNDATATLSTTKNIALDFKQYLFSEQTLTNTQIDSKIKFWENYLYDARLCVFPKQHIVSAMDRKNIPYSTYVEIPEATIQTLKAFCTKNYVNISDAICAALSKALIEHHDETLRHKQPVLINLIKSTRDTLEYDKTIGCFVRIDPLKVMIDKHSTLSDLSKQVHNTMVDISAEQRFSSLLKFACFINCFNKKSRLKGWITRLAMPIYVKLLQLLKVNYSSYKAFELCWRLASFNRKNVFLVNLNLWNNFITDPNKKSESLFGMQPVDFPMPRYELSTLDYILDVCFLRDDARKTPYMVISTNLTPEFRTSIARRTIELFSESVGDS